MEVGIYVRCDSMERGVAFERYGGAGVLSNTVMGPNVPKPAVKKFHYTLHPFTK